MGHGDGEHGAGDARDTDGHDPDRPRTDGDGDGECLECNRDGFGDDYVSPAVVNDGGRELHEHRCELLGNTHTHVHVHGVDGGDLLLQGHGDRLGGDPGDDNLVRLVSGNGERGSDGGDHDPGDRDDVYV